MGILIAISFIVIGFVLIMAGKAGKPIFEYIRSLSGGTENKYTKD